MSTSRSLVGSSSKQDVAAGAQHLGQLDPVAFAAGDLAHLLLLVAALETETRHVRAGVDLAVPDDHLFLTLADLVEDRRVGVEIVARLIDVGEGHRAAHFEGSGVGRLLTQHHLEERRLTGAVRADDPDDAARREEEVQDLR